jgi:hypothetical protein
MKGRNNNLHRALKKAFILLNENLLEEVVVLLNFYLETKSISYKTITQLISDNPIDPLLFLIEKNLFISKQSTHGTLEWGDSAFNLKPNTTFRMPSITESLLRRMQEKGFWNVDEVVKEKFRQIEDPNYRKMPRLIRQIYLFAQDQQIDGSQIRHLCEKMDIEDRIDSIISELKGLGIMSPTITRSLFSSVKSKSPYYELNPLLFTIYMG